MTKQFAPEYMELSYMAGIVDGEGCITVVSWDKRPGDYYVRLIVGNTSKELLDWISARFGGTVRPRKKIDNQLQSYVWRANGTYAKSIIKSILPYLIVKQPQASLIAEFPILTSKGGTSTQHKTREFIFYELRRLNSGKAIR